MVAGRRGTRPPHGKAPDPRSGGGPAREGSAERVLVRPMEEADLDRVTEVEEGSFSVPWSREAFRNLLGRPGVLCRVMERETGSEQEAGPGVSGQPPVVGHAVLWCLADEAELANIAVAPEARGGGLGGRLLDSLLDEVREESRVRRVFLEVRRSDERAQRLYRSRGFRRLGIRRNYYRRPREDALVMALAVPPAPSNPQREET